MAATTLTANDRLLRSMSESTWQETVTGMATVRRWRWYHAPDNRPLVAKSGKRYVQDVKAGFPDLVLVRGDRLIFAELKRETGKTSPEQEAWLLDLAGCGVECYVWRPSDVNSVRAVLT